MTDALHLKIEPLTHEAFAPFGDVIEASDAVKHFPINAGNTERYHDLANLDAGEDGRVIVSIFRGLPRALPFIVPMMERHPKGSQAFVPLSGRPYLVVVARPGEPPTAGHLRCFLATAAQGVNYAKGVWHHPLMALDEVSDFLVIDRSGPGNNCDEIELAPVAIIPAL
ncbi:ureidoglycolate lyase [Uliginosibacterium sp. H3]|uniref:Ureidoglycolate lyase n=1 Tax=Uliginosibacterium silvisoli TaxID=3114758 RepID=A0ABU6K3X0_9RHOO|nr:ureidoglycolate lyase [Uliginosibacterium sp. H3]